MKKKIIVSVFVQSGNLLFGFAFITKIYSEFKLNKTSQKQNKNKKKETNSRNGKKIALKVTTEKYDKFKEIISVVPFTHHFMHKI